MRGRRPQEDALLLLSVHRMGPRLVSLLGVSLSLGAEVLLSSACHFRESSVQASASASAPLIVSASLPDEALAPPRGMVWIPPGILLAGTPENQLPRVPDAEMPGSQVVMHGFLMDEFPYPNERDAIPKTNVTRDEAAALCEDLGKRLCTELEWERACKGPLNTTYESGNSYRAADCDTGIRETSLPPAGLLPSCRSKFGVRDLHGVVFEWTASPWGRGVPGDLVAVRGGNGPEGDVVARCANAIPRAPGERRVDLGFRCCQGERNLAEVTLDVIRGGGLQEVGSRRDWIATLRDTPPAALDSLLKAATERERHSHAFEVLHSWRWHPIGNDEMILQAGCASYRPHPVCGVAISHVSPLPEAKDAPPTPIGFASTAWWLPELRVGSSTRELWIYGGDFQGQFRRQLSYLAGRVEVGPAQHRGKRSTP